MYRSDGDYKPWGTLDGVRPHKFLSRQIQLLGDAGAIRSMIEEYGVAPDKAALMYGITRYQSYALEAIDDSDVAVYVHIPFCTSRCLYCSFAAYAKRSEKLLDAYTDTVVDEVSAFCIPAGRRVVAVYIGGGTPTSIGTDRLSRVIDALRDTFDLSRVREFTVEAGRPDSITSNMLDMLHSRGVTRICVNPQTLSQRTLDAIGRSHSVDDYYNAIALARGRFSVNSDVIAGLPEESADDFARTLDGVLSVNPNGVTVHAMCIKRGSLLNRDYTDYVHEHAVAQDMVSYAYDTLTARGFTPYYMYRQKKAAGNAENVGYCVPGTESLYNIISMTETHTIYAFGAGGVSKFVVDGVITRKSNSKEPFQYIERQRNRCI